jgi:16S rRNA (cytosine967-C5)-methyltransferase
MTNLYVYMAQHGYGVPERHIWALPRRCSWAALTDQETGTGCRAATRSTDLMELHRHNLPQWLVEPLKAQLGDFWPLVESLNRPDSICASSLKASG